MMRIPGSGSASPSISSSRAPAKSATDGACVYSGVARRCATSARWTKIGTPGNSWFPPEWSLWKWQFAMSRTASWAMPASASTERIGRMSTGANASNARRSSGEKPVSMRKSPWGCSMRNARTMIRSFGNRASVAGIV